MDRNIKNDKRRNSFGPLKFPNASSKSSLKSFGFNEECSVCCVLCSSTFTLAEQKEQFLTHLFSSHRLVIGDVDAIASLKSYADYWRIRFSVKPVTYFCTTMTCMMNNKLEDFYLLNDIVPEDKLLREGLQRKRLEWVLEVQAKERETPISRACMLCRLQFDGSRSDYFSHLYEKHHLHLGTPENLVFADELLDLVESVIDKLQCVYCEGLFKGRDILKEHMRKKHHKRINPNNKTYDRFYVINYLEMGKTWRQIVKEPDEIDSDERPDWSDWEEDIESQIVCLYCTDGRSNFEDILEHMSQVHKFDFYKTCRSLQLNFYHQVKLVNYIRLQMFKLLCSFCEEAFSVKSELLQHMSEKNHFKVPKLNVWNHPEYYFPTYENDNFLCFLDEIQDDESDNEETEPDMRYVLAERTPSQNFRYFASRHLTL